MLSNFRNVFEDPTTFEGIRAIGQNVLAYHIVDKISFEYQSNKVDNVVKGTSLKFNNFVFLDNFFGS